MALEEYTDLARQVDKTFLLRSLGLATAFLLVLQLRGALVNRAKLKAIPTVGSSGILTSWKDSFKSVFHVRDVIEEGYRTHYGGVFKIPFPDKWMVVVTGNEKMNDIRKASDEQLSFADASIDARNFQMDHTVGHRLSADHYHVDVIRGPLTRNIVACFADVQDEIKAAFKDYIPMNKDWTEVPAYQTALQIVCRASNRMFVDLPLCRNRDYIDLNINFTVNVTAYAHVLNLFPSFLKPILGSIFTPRRNATAKMEKFLGETIRERLRQDDLYGKDWPGKPNDVISWLIDATNGDGERRTVQDLILRVLVMNFAAIHTTSITFNIALLSGTRQKQAIAEEGWTKAAMGKMNQLDSFIKEAQRRYGSVSVFSMARLVKKDFVFSDGTVVPAGNQIAVAAQSIHMDEGKYEDPLEFKPWRFYDMRKEEGESNRHQMISLDLDYVLFGNGRPACPGRFFAVNELKTLMSYVLVNFDVKMDKVPEAGWFLSDRYLNPDSKVLFRKRATV
ncbi:cytochrome P450 [Desarmillaria tabescens]|uniref:Cytochrome P450 n=1 Tax=Armillaria tabescens TaxID=1929756 RepID=A0AA39JUC0_ARMTA|nr:cytochrome P450 [Desarmillaria tabescens]KAK0448919.1 cytochrome P450 [Desarmillaria tabescens]